MAFQIESWTYPIFLEDSMFSKSDELPLFDPRDAFGDHNDPKTKRFLKKYSTRKPAGGTENISGMVRRDNPSTSVAAAHIVRPRVTKLQQRVLEAFAHYGPMTDEELERLEQFSNYGPTTVKKRRTELYQSGYIVRRYTKRNSRGVKMIVWDLPVEHPSHMERDK